jgi:hypothetical protein
MEEICERNIESNSWKVDNGLEQGGEKTKGFLSSILGQPYAILDVKRR